MRPSKIIWLTVVLLAVPLLRGDQRLATLIGEQKWTALAAAFSDDSHLELRHYFSPAGSTRFVTYQAPKLTYKAKFADHAEIGTITYVLRDGRYAEARISNQIRPLFFIEGFKRFKVNNLTFRVGEAACTLIEGSLFLTEPFGQALFFVGRWRFSITPGDDEERRTLRQLVQGDTLSHVSGWAIFVLKDKDFLETLSPVAIRPSDLVSAQRVETVYRSYFGIQVRQFDEHWYLPFKEDDNLIIFEKNKKNLYLYDFNATLTPDTQLRTTPEDLIVLSYNALDRTKIVLENKDKIDRIHLNLFFNPDTKLLSGTVGLWFATPSAFRVLNLAESLKIRASLDLENSGLSLIRKGRAYYFLGPVGDRLSFYYSGRIDSEPEYTDIFKKQVYRIDTIDPDSFFFLSRTQNYYPNSTIDFARTRLSISLPPGTTCLASGRRRQTEQASRTVTRFTSPGTKGVSIACGRFVRVKRLDTDTPINVYSPGRSLELKNFHVTDTTRSIQEGASFHDTIQNYFDMYTLAQAMDFLQGKFGRPDTPEIDILLKQGLQEGGVSNQGFIFFNYNPDAALSRRVSRRSPIVITEDPTNHLIHELGHQWWGGRLSWSTYRDVWITEGFAQFSLLYYLETVLEEKRFRRVLRRLKRGISEHNDRGPVIYGQRLRKISDDPDAYQVIVYNKSAFVLLMLKDLLGEDEFLRRTRNVLDRFKHRSVQTGEFINGFAGGSEDTARFLRDWITTRRIPEISLDMQQKGKTARLAVRQNGSAFTFALPLIVTTARGTHHRRVRITQPAQTLLLRETDIIRDIRLDEDRTLVRRKRT